jgi:type IV secretory pathway VirB6-like protein
MTIAERPRSHVRLAGVPWPVYKLVALAVGLVSLVVVGAATASAATAVLTAAGAATVVWLALGPLRP